MSFLYPRLVSFRRPNPNAGTGALPYSGETSANESTLLNGTKYPASIQHRSGRGGPPGNLPADAPSKADWYIFVRMPALGALTERDIVTDDLGKRYQITAAYWNSNGYRISAELLEM